MNSVQSSINKKRINWREKVFKFIFLFPALFGLLVFMYYPIVETFRISLMRASGLGGETFIGLTNYFKLLSGEEFQLGFLHILQWAFFSVMIQLPLAFFIAFACVNYKTKIIKRVRSIYYLGNVLPSTVTAMLGLFIFMPNQGIVVTLGKVLNWNWLEKIDFLGDKSMTFWSLFALATWAYMGFQIIYLMANIDQIPTDLHEAAMIDGANRMQYAWHIVIPHISYALRIQAILITIGSIKLFELPWLVIQGGPGLATVTPVITLYREGFINGQYGKAAAVGVLIFFISLIFTIIQFSLRRESDN